MKREEALKLLLKIEEFRQECRCRCRIIIGREFLGGKNHEKLFD